jgi:hypothetical protein
MVDEPVGPREPDVSPTGVPQHLPSGSPADVAESQLGVGTPSRNAVRESLPLPRWLGPLAIVCVLGLIPWIVYLAFNLPRHSRATHYNLAWVGFDIGMGLVLLALGYSALRRRPTTELFAGVAATMLVVDAWFDVVTAPNREQLGFSIASAAFVELPLAALCTWVAVNAERVRSRTYRRLWRRAEEAILEVERLRSDVDLPFNVGPQ